MILHNYVFVAGSTNPGCCFTWCFRRFCHVVGFLDFRLLRFCLSTANRNWSWNPIGQGSRFFLRMTKGTPGNEVGGELEKNACAENTIEACGNMWMSEQLSCCCSCSFSCNMVSLELVVLLPSYIFLTEVVLTRRLHFFVQAIIPMPMTRKLSELSPMRRLKRIATFGSIILPKLTRKEKPWRWVTLKIEGFTEKAQTKLLVHCVQNSECKFQDASA